MLTMLTIPALPFSLLSPVLLSLFLFS